MLKEARIALRHAVDCHHCLRIGSSKCADLDPTFCEMEVVPALGKPLAESPCVRCGRCVTVCPTGSVFMQEHKDELIYAGHQYGLTTVAQLSENILPELEDLFKMPAGTLTLERVAAGLKKIGIDYVVSDREAWALSASEGTAALKAKLSKTSGPVVLTSSFASRNFVDRYFSDLAEAMVVYPPAQQVFGRYVKGEFAAAHKLDASKIRTIVVNSDHENGAEAHETGSVDFSINARELYRIFMRTGKRLVLRMIA